eukprot:TRINITY_DN2031_c0_g1_i1.p1 TRINITY_DN2031_c0_g1~~TRINITY_DN2031_c0_g1_i1.p1  ORF type:complete len:408 (-),score=109.26 TRINITY_DN2031_c0_g1_i1:152-1375(-)
MDDAALKRKARLQLLRTQAEDATPGTPTPSPTTSSLPSPFSHNCTPSPPPGKASLQLPAPTFDLPTSPVPGGGPSEGDGSSTGFDFYTNPVAAFKRGHPGQMAKRRSGELAQIRAEGSYQPSPLSPSYRPQQRHQPQNMHVQQQQQLQQQQQGQNPYEQQQQQWPQQQQQQYMYNHQQQQQQQQQQQHNQDSRQSLSFAPMPPSSTRPSPLGSLLCRPANSTSIPSRSNSSGHVGPWQIPPVSHNAFPTSPGMGNSNPNLNPLGSPVATVRALHPSSAPPKIQGSWGSPSSSSSPRPPYMTPPKVLLQSLGSGDSPGGASPLPPGSTPPQFNSPASGGGGGGRSNLGWQGRGGWSAPPNQRGGGGRREGGFGRGRGKTPRFGEANALERPDMFYQKSMVEDPWRNLY